MGRLARKLLLALISGVWGTVHRGPKFIWHSYGVRRGRDWVRWLIERYAEHRFAGTSSQQTTDKRSPQRGVDPDEARFSVIVPARDRLDLTRRCIETLLETHANGILQIILIDNGSQQAETLDWLNRIREEPHFEVIRCDEPFNWSRLNNLGARVAEHEFLVFLNNDTESTQKNWLNALAQAASDPEVGVVGPMLCYPDGSIQHAGLVIGMCGCVGHVFAGASVDFKPQGYPEPAQDRDVSAVTGACMMMRRDVYDAIGGFDEAYQVAGSDVAVCMDAIEAGLRNRYLGSVSLLHLESATRRREPSADIARLQARIQQQFAFVDPFYPQTLSYEYRIPCPSRGLWR